MEFVSLICYVINLVTKTESIFCINLVVFGEKMKILFGNKKTEKLTI